MKKINIITKIPILLICLILMVACEQGEGPFSSWENRALPKTKITEFSQTTITLANPSETDEQRVQSLGFNEASNKAGHFQLTRTYLGNKDVSTSDIVIPPKGELKILITYAPLNLITSVADYGNWQTGQKPRWIPGQTEETSDRRTKTEKNAIHRAVLEILYDHPTDGIVMIHLIGTAVKGPNGEEEISTGTSECFPGNGVACYTGGFAIDIPALYAGGPKDLELTGAVKFSISSGKAKLAMDDFPPVLMYLRSEEIPELPAGVTATLIISGSPEEEATGTFDGSRLELNDLSFRIRVVLGEIKPEDITPGISAMVDFAISGITMKTISPLESGKITLHAETTLANAPSGNPLFDDFLSGAQIILVMNGQMAF